MNTETLYKEYLNNNYIVLNYDLEQPKTEPTTVSRVLKDHAYSKHNEYVEFDNTLMEMRAIVGEYLDNHYIVAKKLFDKTIWEVVKYEW